MRLRLRLPASAIGRAYAQSTATASLRNLAWLVACLALVAAPHLERLPAWIPLMALMLFVWRLYLAWRRLPLPPRWLLLGLTFGGVAGIYLSFGTILGRNSGVAMLLMLVALKLMELRTQRDAMLVVFLSYFVVITNFLYSQSIPMAAYLLGVVFLITLTLQGLNCMAATPPLPERLRLAGVLLAQALPLMVVLFVFFPRVQGPLWSLPADAQSGRTGLSERMSPGSISELLLSDEIAFRVNFLEEGPPPAARMYWRGPVLTDFDGQAWEIGRPRFPRRPDVQGVGAPISYEVTLEPHYRPWLLGLEMPATRPPRSTLSPDFQLMSLRPVRERMRYQLTSYLDYRIGAQDTAVELGRSLALPQGLNPRARALAEGWRAESPDAQRIVQQALEHFRAEPFVYTLQPPLLGEHTVDDFLFGSRRGFCEHYASAFTFLMRAAGVPARVVTGYQGGEVNPLGNYVIVRQADAHAWSEVWIEGRGWLRVDPTAAVAPERVESGINAALPAGESLPLLVRTDLEWLLRLRLAVDSVAFRWNQWVLGYNPDRQLEFLARLGMRAPDWRSMASALLTGTGLLMLAFSAWILRRLPARPADPALAAYLRFCRKLAGAGLPRRPGEGPRDYAGRVRAARPALADAVERITALYIALRYGNVDDPGQTRQLRRMVAQFRASSPGATLRSIPG